MLKHVRALHSVLRIMPLMNNNSNFIPSVIYQNTLKILSLSAPWDLSRHLPSSHLPGIIESVKHLSFAYLPKTISSKSNRNCPCVLYFNTILCWRFFILRNNPLKAWGAVWKCTKTNIIYNVICWSVITVHFSPQRNNGYFFILCLGAK